MNTKWMGLWKQERNGLYAGQVVKKTDIPKYTRIVLRYNKFYDKDLNRPKFVYCFADSAGYEKICVPILINENESDDLQSKINKLSEILRQGKRNADVMRLPSESQAIAESLEERAIEIIEDITGEKWDFTYLTF